VLEKECQDIKEEILAISVISLDEMYNNESDREVSRPKQMVVGRRLKKMISQLPLMR